MIQKTHSKTDSGHHIADRWWIIGSLVAIVVAAGCLIAGVGKTEQTVPQNIAPIPAPAKEESEDLSRDQTLSQPDAEIQIETLENVKVPVVGLEEELYQKIDAMFVKPEEALQDLEIPSPDKIPEP